MKSVQGAVFANSWYENDSQAHLRWEIRGGNYEVAIRSTVNTLKVALSVSSQKICMSRMQYIDFASAPMPTGNVFFPPCTSSTSCETTKRCGCCSSRPKDRRYFRQALNGV